MKVKVIKDFPGAKVGDVLDIEVGENGKNQINLSRFGYLLENLEGEFVEEVEESEIKDHDSVFLLSRDGDLEGCEFRKDSYHEELLSRGFVSKDRERLELFDEFLQLRASNGGWIPKEDEEFYHSRWDGNTYLRRNIFDTLCLLLISIGDCYRTEEEAENVAPRWKAYFEKLEDLSRKQA